MNNRRSKIRAISFLTSLILVLGVWGASSTVRQYKYARIITASRQQALSDLGSYMDNIQTSLTKGLYCNTSPMLSNMASSLWRDATGAKTSLSHLGDSEIHLLGTYKFLSQVGDYMMYLNKKTAAGEQITREEYENLNKLRSYAQKYSEQIDYMREMMHASSFSFDKIDAALLSDDSAQIMNFSDAAADYENNIGDYPTLIYDGPFSDNIMNKKSEMLKNDREISKLEAKKKASEFLKTTVDRLEDAGTEESNLPSYIFSFSDRTVAVTKQGGYIRYLISGTFAQSEKISAKEAIDKGKTFLEQNRYFNMSDSYYSVSDGIATVNYAYYEGNICCYTDLIKVGIALDTGEIVSFDATGFLMNHKDRSDLFANADIDKAKSCISSMLSVQSWKYALIPTEGGREVLTVEFLCKSEDNTDVLVYINPLTNTEEEILLLTYSDNGILTK